MKYVELEAKMYHFETWVSTTDATILKTKLEKILTKIDFTIINFTEHHFEIEGYTCVWLLAESHLAVHTFPKSNRTFIQLSSCNLEKKNLFEQFLIDF